MADGSIAIAITVDGKEVKTAGKDLDELSKKHEGAFRDSQGRWRKANGQLLTMSERAQMLGKDIDGVGEKSNKMGSNFKSSLAAFAAVKVASAAFNVLKTSMSAAADRFDEFQKFPKVMDALGFSAEESKNSINKLSNGIEGLPTTLNDVTSQTRQLTAITGDLGKSTDTVLALNNAFLASGASSADASRGMIQYNQMLSKGTVDMLSWHSLQETMPLGLQKTAEAMGFVGKTAQQDLYKALQSGKVTFDDFNNQLIKLGTGTGQLATLAKTNSEGIATSFTNLKNAAVKGLATVLEALNNVSKKSTGNSIAKNLDGLKVAVNGAFSLMVSAIKATTPLVKVLSSTLGALMKVASQSIPQIAGLTAGFVAWRASLAITSALEKANALIVDGKASTSAFATVVKTMTAFQTANNTAIAANVAVETARTGQLTLSAGRMAVLATSTTASTLATTAMTAATLVFKAALDVLTGGIGLVITGVTALVGIFMIHSKRQKEAKEAAEKETKAYHELNKSISSNRVEREKSIKSAESESAINDNLINSLSELYSKSKATKAEKKDMADTVDQLNKKYSDLNLVYNQETGYLNQSIDLVRQKTKAYEAQSKVSAYNEAINANLKEQIQLETQSKVLKDNIAKLEKEKAEASYGQLTSINAKIKEQKDTLNETHAQYKSNAEEKRILDQDRISSINEAATAEQLANDAINQSSQNKAIVYEQLEKNQQEAFDAMKTQYESLVEASTNAFDRIDTSSKYSLGQMVENMQFNTEATKQWSENQASLISWAGQNGYEQFIPYIESMGIDQAGVLAEMTKGIDANNVEQAVLLAQLAQTYQTGYTTAGEAGKKALSTGLSGVSDEVYKAVIEPIPGLNTQVASAFAGMGKGATDSLVSSITTGSSAAKTAADALAGKVKEGFQLPLGITGSTSSVMENAGKSVVQGAKNGIDNNKKLVADASGNVWTNVK